LHEPAHLAQRRRRARPRCPKTAQQSDDLARMVARVVMGAGVGARQHLDAAARRLLGDLADDVRVDGGLVPSRWSCSASVTR
jgi:hypothetical protein